MKGATTVFEVLERITDAFFALDRHWRFTYLNTEAERLLQRSREELLGRDVWKEFPEAVHRDFYRQYHRAMDEQVTVSFEEHYPPLESWFEVRAYPSEEGLSVFFRDIQERKRAEQVPLWFQMRVTRYVGPGPMRVVVAHEDVTARRIAEEATRRLARVEAAREEAEAAQARLHAVFERITDGFIAFDRDWRFTYVNRHAERHFSLKREEMLGQRMLELFPNLAGSRVKELLDRAAREQVPLEAEVPSALTDRWLLFVVYPSPEGVSLYFRDITEQRRAQERQRFLSEVGATLARSLDSAETVQAVARLAVPVLADGCALLLGEGPPEKRIFGVAAVQPALEDSLREALTQPESRSGSLGEAMEQALRTGTPVLLPDARLVTLPLLVHERRLGVLVLVKDARSPGQGLEEELALVRELAHRASLALENARLYLTAQQAVAMRDETLGIVSHDLRSPLSAISLLCSLIEQYQLPEGDAGLRARDSLRRIRQAVLDMNRLIEDLLAVARMEGGRLSLDTEPLEVAPLLAQAHELHEPLATDKSLRLEVQLAPHLPLVRADRSRVQQVFQNLVGNALKFTPSGGRILLRAEPVDGFVRLCVEDSGRGIEPELLPHVFDRFWQARHARHAGAGLGLAIVKGIIEAHGGSIHVESRVGQGTTFVFTLPVA